MGPIYLESADKTQQLRVSENEITTIVICISSSSENLVSIRKQKLGWKDIRGNMLDKEAFEKLLSFVMMLYGESTEEKFKYAYKRVKEIMNQM